VAECCHASCSSHLTVCVLLLQPENNEPPHIPIRQDRSLAKFWLNPISLTYNSRFPNQEITHLRKLVEEHRELLLRWNDYFEGTTD